MWFFNLSFLSPVTIARKFMKQKWLWGKIRKFVLLCLEGKQLGEGRKGRCGDSGGEEEQPKSSSRPATDGSRGHGFLPVDLWERGGKSGPGARTALEPAPKCLPPLPPSTGVRWCCITSGPMIARNPWWISLAWEWRLRPEKGLHACFSFN